VSEFDRFTEQAFVVGGPAAFFADVRRVANQLDIRRQIAFQRFLQFTQWFGHGFSSKPRSRRLRQSCPTACWRRGRSPRQSLLPVPESAGTCRRKSFSRRTKNNQNRIRSIG